MMDRFRFAQVAFAALMGVVAGCGAAFLAGLLTEPAIVGVAGAGLGWYGATAAIWFWERCDKLRGHDRAQSKADEGGQT